MWFKHRAWIPVSWLLSVINVAAVWFAATPAEPWHATTHALLAVLFALGAQHLSARGRPAVNHGEPDQLQQSIDAIALEVERISEGQRYVTKMVDERLRQSIDARRPEQIPFDRKETREP